MRPSCSRLEACGHQPARWWRSNSWMVRSTAQCRVRPPASLHPSHACSCVGVHFLDNSRYVCVVCCPCIPAKAACLKSQVLNVCQRRLHLQQLLHLHLRQLWPFEMPLHLLPQEACLCCLQPGWELARFNNFKFINIFQSRVPSPPPKLTRCSFPINMSSRLPQAELKFQMISSEFK